MIYGNVVGCTGQAQTYILQDENGNEFTAVLVDTETVLDATENDIRKGKIAATENGITVGTKEIPAYHTTEGYRIIQAGSMITIPMLQTDKCEYTKLQAIICAFNTSSLDSVSAEMVAIDDKVYAVMSTTELATVNADVENSEINFGILNSKDTPVVVRYFTYKEEV